MEDEAGQCNTEVKSKEQTIQRKRTEESMLQQEKVRQVQNTEGEVEMGKGKSACY